MSFGVSHIKAVGLAIIAAIPLAIGNPVALACDEGGVLRCRAIQQPIQRRDCFEYLKKGPKAKAEEAAKAKTENAPYARLGRSITPPCATDNHRLHRGVGFRCC